jgi:hypothetical protein
MSTPVPIPLDTWTALGSISGIDLVQYLGLEAELIVAASPPADDAVGVLLRSGEGLTSDRLADLGSGTLYAKAFGAPGEMRVAS